MAGFYDSLRKNGLFTDDNPNPLRPPVAPNFDAEGTFSRLFPYVSAEKQKDRDLQLQLAQMRMGNGNLSKIAGNLGAPAKPIDNMFSSPTANVRFDDRGDQANTFASNILNPPERGFKFQDLKQKRELAEANLALKEGDQSIRQQRADTTQFSAETRRRLASLKDLSDSEKLQMLQDGKISLEELKQAGTMNAIGARGEEARKTEGVRGNNRIAEIRERGQQTKPTKEITPTQVSADQKNKARELVNTNKELGQYINFDDKGNFTISPDTPLNILSTINSTIYGKDKQLGTDKSSFSNVPKNDNVKDDKKIESVDRTKAEEALRKHGIPVTEENLKKAMDPKNWK